MGLQSNWLEQWCNEIDDIGRKQMFTNESRENRMPACCSELSKNRRYIWKMNCERIDW